ncbi:hypothetical protein EJ04DRAFT_560187 [Polyplosphaeria fusca]|uniref:Uncharacterized protein n=1 Tax=Polyplosphaeria fusca TaxID=682080 RepID=A0A9P4V3W6_9PLEO|nr:hypothetical protein EJ04DRAFT_560187 [Polyplosphaeria fusca]
MPSLNSFHRLTTFLLLGTAIAPSQAFTFFQTHTSRSTDVISQKQFLATPFDQLCPSGNCIDDCGNNTRIFQAKPDHIDATVQDYGQPDASGKVNVTVFGLCTNLVSAAAEAEDSTKVKSFFATDPSMMAVSDPFKQVAIGIAACLSDTCGRIRYPGRCMEDCSMKNLLNNNTDAFDWQHAMLNCTQRLCKSTFVLPYANQDVLGIGVLVSFCTQGILLLGAAAGAMASLTWQLWRGQGSYPRIVRKLEGPLATFLTAQTYFSISAAIASFVMSPSTIDPLNGYALMIVATIGFLCPVFTLLLLRSHNARTGFGTSLTFVSWILNTVIFFMLLRNLSDFGETVAEDALKQLFTVPTCDDSSAMPLCQQLTGSNPLKRLTGFFKTSSWTNIRTVPMLWAWTTFVLLVLIPEETWQAVRLRRMNKAAARKDAAVAKIGKDAAPKPDSRPDAEHLLLGRFIIATIFVVLFSVGLGYIFDMVKRFRAIGAIDASEWSFGQVVAAMFWIPVFLDVAHSVFVEKKHHVSPTVSPQEEFEMKPKPSTNRSAYTPLSKSSLEDRENEDQRAHSPPTAPVSVGPRKRSIHKRQTIRMEEGQ